MVILRSNIQKYIPFYSMSILNIYIYDSLLGIFVSLFLFSMLLLFFHSETCNVF